MELSRVYMYLDDLKKDIESQGRNLIYVDALEVAMEILRKKADKEGD